MGICAIDRPQPTDLRPQDSSSSEFLQYPASLSDDPTGQFNAFVRGQTEPGEPLPSTHSWLADPGLLNPWRTAQIYFYYAGPSNPAHWPAVNRTIPAGLVALQYWFFYPYNYYPTLATPDLMNGAPLAGDVANTDLHQGDWEHVTVLVDPHTGKPILRPATKPVTLHHLLTHTSGFAYDTWDESMLKYNTLHGGPAAGTVAPLTPLIFEPGTRWQYGTSMDWAGRLVEAVSGLRLPKVDPIR